MTSKLTREQMLERARENVKALKMASRQHAFESAREEILADLQIAEYALACLEGVDSEPNRNPVLPYADSYRDMAKQGVESVPIWSVITDLERNIAPLYRHAQPAPDREQIRNEHAEWSQSTFGSVGPIGPLKHLSKEALEAAAEPGDLSEWADMQFLLWDAQRRAGITDEQITQAMIAKLAVNKQREWPEPKEGEPRLHIKEQPAPVVTFYRDGIEAAAKWIDKQREAYDSEHGWSDPDTGAFEFGNDAQRGYSSTLEELAEGIRALHPNAGNSPAIPEGYVMVPKEPTAEMIAAAMNCDDVEFNGDETFCVNFDNIYAAMVEASPQEVKGE